MFRFFRNLRHRMLSENKTSRYLLYAIGEIVLVVLGILIAFQVNSWKETRILEKDKNLLLQNLRADFQLRKNELLEFDAYFDKEINALNIVLPLFNSPDALPDPASTDSLLSFTRNAYSLNESFKLLDLLFNTGQIDLIENRELKALLLEWPFLAEETLEEQRSLAVLDMRIGFPELARHISFADLGQYVRFRNYGKSSYGSKMEKDYTGLFRNKVYENFLATRLEFLRIMKQDRLVMIERADRILQAIASELGDSERPPDSE
jgi:hypothetical protein